MRLLDLEPPWWFGKVIPCQAPKENEFEVSYLGNISVCQRKLNKAHQIFQPNITSLAIPLKRAKEEKEIDISQKGHQQSMLILR